MGQVVQKGALGEAVRDFAMAKGISISALERNAGYSPGMISRWIAAGPEDYYSLSKLVTLADLLEVSLDELLGRQQGAPTRDSQDDPVSRLAAETRTGQLVWGAWQPDDGPALAGPIPSHEGGRPCCGGWWAQRDGLKFLLALFCDDIDDEDEPIEFSLCCTPGHGLPLILVPNTVPAALSNLYTQILIVNAFAPYGGRTSSAVLPFTAQDGKTVVFRRSNG